MRNDAKRRERLPVFPRAPNNSQSGDANSGDTQRSERLLYSREQVAHLLGGISAGTVRRLEQQGRLKPIRLSRSPVGQVFFRAADVIALVDEANDAAFQKIRH